MPCLPASRAPVGEATAATACGVVLAVPHLVESQRVEMLGELEVALQRQRRVGTRAVEGGDEVSEPQLGHRRLLALEIPRTISPACHCRLRITAIVVPSGPC